MQPFSGAWPWQKDTHPGGDPLKRPLSTLLKGSFPPGSIEWNRGEESESSDRDIIDEQRLGR